VNDADYCITFKFTKGIGLCSINSTLESCYLLNANHASSNSSKYSGENSLIN